MARFSRFFFRNRRYEDIAVSIQEHIDERIDELVEEGMPRDEAERSARRDFGNVTLLRERSREVWQWQRLQSLRLKPMHGYALVKHIKQVSDNLLQVEEGSLYPALQRMLKEGLLEAETGTSAKGRPTRIYRLTDAGIRHLEREVVSFERMFAGFTRVLATAKT